MPRIIDEDEVTSLDGTYYLAAFSQTGSKRILPGNLPFTQSGTGAAARTQQDKAREVEYSVKDFYGSTATQTGDICAAMAAAYAAGRVLDFPEGIYTINFADMPGGTNYCPQLRGRGKVTINLTGAVTFRVAHPFSVENIDFVTTYTYPNATVTYFALFDTGNVATSPRLIRPRFVNVSYNQLTVTDGSARGYSFAHLYGGVTDMYVENVQMEGVREGFEIYSDGHDGETTSCIRGLVVRGLRGKNMQRLLVPNAVSGGPLFGNTGLDIKGFSLVNTLTQRDNYSGGGRTGHSPLIGDTGTGAKIEMYIEHPIEHAAYIYGRGFSLTMRGRNCEDISISGTAASPSSGRIVVEDYVMTVASYTNTHSIASLRMVDGIEVDVRRFKGTNLSGGFAGNMIRPWSVTDMQERAKNVRVRARGQYLLAGTVNYSTGASQEEAFENITIEDCEVLDPVATTSSGYAALQRFDANFPTLPWYSAGTPLIKNLRIRKNYFGVTTETADTAETTTVIGRGRSGTKLLGLFHCADMAGVLSEDNPVDGWYGDDASLAHPIGVVVAAANAAGHCSDVVIRETYQGLTTTTFVTGPNNLVLGEGSEITYLNNGAAATPSGRMVASKGRASGAATGLVDYLSNGGMVAGSITFSLIATGTLNVLPSAINGRFDFRSTSGIYGYGELSNGAIVSLHAHANADVTTDTGAKLCTFVSGAIVVCKNNTAGTLVVTLNFQGGFYS